MFFFYKKRNASFVKIPLIHLSYKIYHITFALLNQQNSVKTSLPALKLNKDHDDCGKKSTIQHKKIS